MSGELILYETEDGQSRIQLRAADGTVWLMQAGIAELFATSKQNVSLHLKNIFYDKELSEGSVVKESLATAEVSSVVQTGGPREVKRPLTVTQYGVPKEAV